MGEKGEKLFWTGVDRVMNIVLLGPQSANIAVHLATPAVTQAVGSI